MPQPKSGCTGAIFPSSRHELKAWQTGGVHVRSFAKRRLKVKPGDSGHSLVANADPDKFEGERLHLVVANWRCRPTAASGPLKMLAAKPTLASAR